MDFTELFMSILLTAVSYMAFPFIRLLINGEKFEKKQAHKIALWNSIICGLVFCIAASAADVKWKASPAILYYWINYAIIADRTKKESNNEIECQKEELQINLQEEHSNEPPEEKGKEDQKIEEFEHQHNEVKQSIKKNKITRLILVYLGIAICCFAILTTFVEERKSSRHYVIIQGELIKIEEGIEEGYQRGDLIGSSNDAYILIETVFVSLVSAGLLLGAIALIYRQLFKRRQSENDALESIRSRIAELEKEIKK